MVQKTVSESVQIMPKGRGDNDGWHDSESEHTFHGQSIKSKNPHNVHSPFHGGDFNRNQGIAFTAIVLLLVSIGIPFLTYSTQANNYRITTTTDLDPFTTLWNGQIPSSYSTTTGSSGNIAFSSKVNATCAVSCASTSTVLTFPSITSGLGDTIIVEWYASQSIVATFKITDSSLNVYTPRLNVTGPGSALNIYFASASSSTSGSLVVTLTASTSDAFAGVVSDYSGAIGFGNTASNTGNGGVGPTTITSTIVITSSATSSFILEYMAVGSSGGTGTVYAFSSQTLRNHYATASAQSSASGAFDITNLSGSQSLSLKSTFTTDQNKWTHGGLELTNSITSAKTCGQVGYKCSNMKIVNGYLQAQSNASYPAIALTNSSIDLSTGASKAIAFNFGLVTNTPFVGEEFGFFLRSNGTLPNGLRQDGTAIGTINYSSSTSTIDSSTIRDSLLTFGYYGATSQSNPNGNFTEAGQCFKPSSYFSLTSSKFWINVSAGAPSGAVVESILYSSSGTLNSTCKSSGTIIATSSTVQLTNVNGYFSFPFNNIPLNTNTVYSISLKLISCTFCNSSNYYGIGSSQTLGFNSNFFYLNNGYQLSNSNAKLAYEVKGNSGQISTTDRFYSPTNDTSVALAVIVTVTSNKYNYYVYMQRQPGQSLFTGTENPTIPCNQAYTIYLCANNSTKADATFPIFPLVLNYTGSANGSSGAGQSYLCNDFGGGSTQCNLGGANNVAIGITNTNFRINYTEPWLNIQNRYYIGLWQKATSNPTLVKFQTATQNVQSAQVISIYSPSSSNSNVAEGGFFGWIGNALGGAFNTVGNLLGPIITPITGLGNSLVSALISAFVQAVSYLAQTLVLVLNSIGNFFGLGNVGTDISLLFSSISTFLSGVLSGIFIFFINSGTYLSNGASAVEAFFSSVSILGLWNGFLGAIPALISALDTFLGYVLYWYNLGVFGFNIIIIFALIILAMSSLIDYEQSGNPIGLFVGILMTFFTFYTMTLPNSAINIIATNPTVLSNYQTAFNNTIFFVRLAPVLFILMLANYISEGSDIKSFSHSSGGFMHNFTTTLHFYQMITIDIFKAGHFIFTFGVTLLVSIKQLVAGWL